MAEPGSSTAPALRQVLETCLYVEDMGVARRFYEQVLGLTPQFFDERIASYRLGSTMLLLFRAGGTLQAVETPAGKIPPHDGRGPTHFALSIPSESLDAWREHLDRHHVPLESEVAWRKDGAISLYFRDPDKHLVELATPGLWGIE
ncbi:MAG: VOC family protein [Rhizobiaceae bacterium]